MLQIYLSRAFITKFSILVVWTLCIFIAAYIYYQNLTYSSLFPLIVGGENYYPDKANYKITLDISNDYFANSQKVVNLPPGIYKDASTLFKKLAQTVKGDPLKNEVGLDTLILDSSNTISISSLGDINGNYITGITFDTNLAPIVGAGSSKITPNQITEGAPAVIGLAKTKNTYYTLPNQSLLPLSL